MGPRKSRASALAGSAVKLAQAGAVAAAPEVAIPVGIAAEALQALGKGRKVSTPHPTQTNALAAPPRPFIVLRKGRVRTRKGVTVVEPDSGLTATEAAAIGALVAAGYGLYVAAKWTAQQVGTVESTAKAVSNPLGWLKL